jgi:hypothetical protein
LLGKYYKIEIEFFIIVYSTIPKMSNYANAAKRGSESSPCDLQPGKVVSVDKEEFYDDEYESEDDYKNDPDYVPESEDDSEDEDEEYKDEEVKEEDEEDNDEEDDKKKDPDYVPESEDDSEDEEDEEDEDDYINDPDYVPEYISPQYEVEKIFGCDGCNYEWKDGWKQGWKAAMKFVVQQANLSTEAPAPPTCDNCGIACKAKRCGGTCKGAVKFCSKKCQAINWKDSHKFICSKNEE